MVFGHTSSEGPAPELRPAKDFDYLDSMITVYVPRPGSELSESVWAGSGIVGSPAGESGLLRVDYEGSTEQYPRYVDRVRRAVDRHQWSAEHRQGYPTQAAARVDDDQVIAVGQYDPEEDRVIVEDETALERWLGVDDLPQEELGSPTS